MFAGKTLTDYTILFFAYDFKSMVLWFWNILKVNESYFVETIDRTNLRNQKNFRLNEIGKIENYFNQEIKKRKLDSMKLSKYVAAFVT